MSGRSQFIGDAGTFLVAAVLAQRQYPVALTSAGTWRTDLLAQVGEQMRPVAIQVKTKSPGAKDFSLNVTEPGRADVDEWVILVALNAERWPDFYVVPRNMVVAICLGFEVVFGASARKFLGAQEFAPWKDNWDAMSAPVSESPWRLPRWIFDRRHDLDPEGCLRIPDDAETFST